MVGTILLAAIIVSTIVTIRTTYVPVWEADAEASHVADVERQFGNLKANLDLAVLNSTNVPLANPVSLGDGRASAFKASGPGVLTFTGGANWMNLSAPKLTLQQVNGTNFAGVNESWTSYGTSTVLTSIDSVLSFRLKIDTLNRDQDGHSIVVVLTDAQGRFAGDFNVSAVLNPPDLNTFATVRNAASVVLVSQQLSSYHQTDIISPYWVDLLDPTLRFDRVLSAAPKPVTVTLQQQGLTGQYAIAYFQSTPNGNILVGGASGNTVAPYQANFPGGSLSYRSGNAYYLDQTFTVDNGALVLTQGDGSVFAVNPGFRVGLIGNITTVQLSMPSLNGNSTSLAQDTLVTVYTSSLGATSLLAVGPSFTMNVTTLYPALWSGFFDSQLQAAGLAASGGQYSVATGANWAAVTINGVDTSGANDDVSITLRQAQVNLQV